MEFCIHYRVFLVLSITIHFLFIALAIWAKLYTPPLIKEEIVYLDLPQTPQIKSKPQNTSGVAPNKGGASGRNGKKWNLTPRGFSLNAPRTYGENGQMNSGNKNGGFALAEKMDLEQETKFYPIANQVLKRLEEEIYYPLELAEERIQGVATVQFMLLEDGTLEKIMEISCEDPTLRVFALYNLIRAFKKPLSKKLSKDHLPFVARLDFKAIQTEFDRIKHQTPQFKNILSIERKLLVPSKTMEEMQYWVDRSPIVPTPAGPIVNFIALYQLVKDKQEADPRWRRFQRVLQSLDLWQIEVKRFEIEQGALIL